MNSIVVLQNKFNLLLTKFGITPNIKSPYQGQKIVNNSSSGNMRSMMQGISVADPMMPEFWFPRPQVNEDTAVKTLTKPKMRGLLASSIKRHLIIGSMLAVLGGMSYKVFVADVRRQAYTDFYRNYNAEEVFESIRKRGHFQSC